MDTRIYTLGLANLSEQIPFAVTVRESIEAATAQRPELRLIIRDNDLNSDKALAHAQEFAALPVDLAIIYHIDQSIGTTLGNLMRTKRIPVIAVDIPILWTVFFGINNKQAGLMAGEALGKWVQAHWGGRVDKVLAVTERRISGTVILRIEAAIDALATYAEFDKNTVFYVDGRNSRQPTAEIAQSVLERWTDQHRIAVICFNDDTALGVLDAARTLGREQDIAVVGQGANLIADEFANPETRFIASTAYYPERYGAQIIDLAVRMLKGERVPRENLIDPVCITRDSFNPA